VCRGAERCRECKRTDDDRWFTTSFGEQLSPFEMLVPAEECALREDSVALCRRIRTISVKHRINKNLGSIPQERMDKIDTTLEYSLGLTEI
jgi:mRNA interferase MazF